MAVVKTIMKQLWMRLALLACIVAPRVPNPEIVAVLASQVKDTSHIVSALETIMDVLTRDGLVTRMQVPPHNVGVHPCNRYGFGVGASNAHRTGAHIVRMGWSWAACAMAICIADNEMRKIAKFTVNMQNGSKLFKKSPESISNTAAFRADTRSSFS